MPAPRLLPDDATLRRLRREGRSYEEIARTYGVTKGAVYLRLSQMGETKDRASYRDLIPWRVKVEHTHARPAQMLRLLGRRLAGKANPPIKDQQLDRWLDDLEGSKVVVIYSPTIPPNPASPNAGGWAYLPWEPQDGDYSPREGKGLIRRPETRTLQEHPEGKAQGNPEVPTGLPVLTAPA